MRLIETKFFHYVPIDKLPLITWYLNLRKKYPILRFIEEYATLCSGIIAVRDIVVSNKIPKSFKFDVNNGDRFKAFEEFLLSEGVNDSICDNQATTLFDILIGGNVKLETKRKTFKIWIINFINSSNAGDKQGSFLCLIAVLQFIFRVNYALLLELLDVLLILLINGDISLATYKLIMRRLKRGGIELPSRFIDVT